MIFSSKNAARKRDAKSSPDLVFVQPEVMSPEEEAKRLAVAVGRTIKSIFAETSEKPKKASVTR